MLRNMGHLDIILRNSIQFLLNCKKTFLTLEDRSMMRLALFHSGLMLYAHEVYRNKSIHEGDFGFFLYKNLFRG